MEKVHNNTVIKCCRKRNIREESSTVRSKDERLKEKGSKNTAEKRREGQAEGE